MFCLLDCTQVYNYETLSFLLTINFHEIIAIVQGLYMKNLLKHITSQDLTVGAVFEHLYSSFTQEEDSSVVDRMKPGWFGIALISKFYEHFRGTSR